jgi:UDP-N-acetylglucosamine--N-acetylmuramyl-(pentapeptide) pyrophosphoryl-undecaprenol N-acetylglucosamine transferase
LTVLLTGGGSGGHTTPVIAVAAEIKRLQPKVKVVYIGPTGDAFNDIASKDANIDKTYTVRAGKFRRYHGEGLMQLLDIVTFFKNIRDFIYLIIGSYQSWRLIGQLRPDVLFSRGSYVSVPVALGAHFRGVPYITHDSDSIPSLTNRLVARWAAWHAVALPKELYPYPADKTVSTGIPISQQFVPVTEKLKDTYRKELNIPLKAKVLFVIGGGLGSDRVNTAVITVVPHLLRQFNDLYVIHGAGGNNETTVADTYKQNLSDIEQKRVVVKGFINDVQKYSGAADLIVTRAGATNLAEFAVQGKACIIVPSPFLSAGHQLKNANYLAKEGAVEVLDEAALLDDPNRLAKLVSNLITDTGRLKKLSGALANYAQPEAATKLAKLVLKVGGRE